MGEALDFIARYGDSPWDSPCWNDDWERDLLEDGYLPVQGWNARGRIVKKGEKGMFLPCARIMVFAEAQTEPSTVFGTTADGGAPVRFETYDEALDWARQNPGRPITRSSDGSGFVAK